MGHQYLFGKKNKCTTPSLIIEEEIKSLLKINRRVMKYLKLIFINLKNTITRIGS